MRRTLELRASLPLAECSVAVELNNKYSVVFISRFSGVGTKAGYGLPSTLQRSRTLWTLGQSCHGFSSLFVLVWCNDVH